MSTTYDSNACPPFAFFIAFAGASLSMILCAAGAGYGTAKSGIGIGGMGTIKPQLIMKALIPVVMAGIISIYGLIIGVLINSNLTPTKPIPLYSAFLSLAAGLSTGLCGVAAGYAIGIVGDSATRGLAKEPRLFVGMVLILIFAEVIGLYGLIVALVINSKFSYNC